MDPPPPLLMGTSPLEAGWSVTVTWLQGLLKQGVRELDVVICWNWLVLALADFLFHFVKE